MNQGELDRFRKGLFARREKLEQSLARFHEQQRNPVASEPDAADQATASYDKNALYREAEHAGQQIELLDDALARIDAGSFGECVMCGQQIATRRLEAIPWARYCVGCQQFQESLR